ncbi:MAG: glycosyltransferase family protein [Polyangiales bacterium]
MNIVIVVQARLGSSRLPGKVLLPAAGRPLLAHMLTRVRAAQLAERVVVATTTDATDAPIVALCEQLEVEYYRGHPQDCLDRHLQVGLHCGADAVVKIPSDCPLIDPAVIDRVIGRFLAADGGYDYVSNLHPASWPDGQDVEVIALSALARAARETQDPFDREHTTPFLWQNPQRFRLHNVPWETGLDYSESVRLVVDWLEDYRVVRAVLEALLPTHGPLFELRAVLSLLAQRPALARENAHHRGYSYFAARTQTVTKENRA